MKKRNKKPATKQTERQDLEFALDGFREIAKQAAADLRQSGLVIKGSQGRTKTNQSAKIFRDAVKTIDSLRKRLAGLEKEEQNTQGKSDGDGWDEFDS